MSTDLRIKALELANNGEDPKGVVNRAEAYLAFLLGGSADVAPPTKTTTVKKDADKPKEEPEADVAAPTETKAEEPVDEAPTVDYADVKRLILGISSKIGRDAATKLLGEFGVEKGPDLKPADYAAFVAKAEPMLEGK